MIKLYFIFRVCATTLRRLSAFPFAACLFCARFNRLGAERKKYLNVFQRNY